MSSESLTGASSTVMQKRLDEASSFPRLAALGLLQHYTNAITEGNTHLKSCLWQLTKSRRKGNVMMRAETAFKADSLREDWRALYRLVNLHETETAVGDLVDEDNNDDQDDNDIKTRAPSIATLHPAPEWKLKDTLQEKENTSPTPSSDPTTFTGLRQRKYNNNNNNNEISQSSKGGEAEDETAWTLVQEEDLERDEEERLLRRDPIEFFGLPSRDLKLAQEKSKQALQEFIQAANRAAQILTILNKEQQQQQQQPKL
ncbi:hypothetical protein IV203_025982 [Nitzschia inconspicua]|uniref:Uncharacterized protein n=1 Tax=Nitzschia inconspicua TaxID=303405 RepID=A0A9K3LK61_9STRA|nr:hypothetical protein IV203_025982 [Nitzschia inconspicua]